MEVKIKSNEGLIDATVEMVDGVMVVSPKEVKFDPKDGDVCTHKDMIYIFKGVKHSSQLPGKLAVIHHCYYDGDILDLEEGVGCGYIDCCQRYATEEEKQKLFAKMKEKGYEWDAEKKEVVKIKWKPKNGESYFYPMLYACKFIFGKYVWNNHEIDISIYNRNWCFKTKKSMRIIL